MTTSATPHRNALWKFLIPVAALLMIVVGALLLVKSQLGDRPANTVEVKVGATLPDFELERFPEGPNSKIKASELGKKLLLVNFWASWCEACMIEMPSLIQLREKYKDRGFEIVGINVDDEPAAVVPKITRELGMSFPIFTDEQGAMAELFDVHAIPLTAIVDAKSLKLLHIESGDRDWMAPEILSKIEEWLKP